MWLCFVIGTVVVITALVVVLQRRGNTGVEGYQPKGIEEGYISGNGGGGFGGADGGGGF